MSIQSFKGGAHPPGRKSRSSRSGIVVAPPQAEVVIPVNQHLGPPLSPIVNVGDRVLRGQPIADGQGRMGIALHASVSGTVKKIENRVQPNNAEGPCIVIQADPMQADWASMPPLDPFTCPRDWAIKRIRDAGIVGMGGAGFPAHVKLDPPPGKKAEFLIGNGAECEPYLTADEALLESGAERVIEGMAMAMKICGAPKGILALEDNKARLVPVLEEAARAKSRGMDIEIRLVKTKYPQGGEKMLISAVTGREVPSGGLPVDAGCIVHNVATLAAIRDAFSIGKPLIDRIVTFSGGALKEAKNLLCPIGLIAGSLVPETLQFASDPRKFVFGGPMMGFSAGDASIPVQKNTSGVLFLTAAETDTDAEGQCIRCGRCMRACSCRLSPALINAALVAGNLDFAEEIGLMDCVDCGTCAWVCPSRIRLVQRFRVGKQLVKEMKQKEAARAK
jgi:Na+-translocating ferredoxin:NAD+ oxidoreductase subunit C